MTLTCGLLSTLTVLRCTIGPDLIRARSSVGSRPLGFTRSWRVGRDLGDPRFIALVVGPLAHPSAVHEPGVLQDAHEVRGRGLGDPRLALDL